MIIQDAELIAKLGQQVIDLLAVKRNKGSHRVDTTSGSKTDEGVGRCILRIINEINNPPVEEQS